MVDCHHLEKENIGKNLVTMSGLERFIGSRGGAENPRSADQGSKYAGGRKERLQAKMQEMGFTDLEGGEMLHNSDNTPANSFNLHRKSFADQHRLKVPTNFVSGNGSGTRSPRDIEKDHESSSIPPHAVYGMSQKKQEASQDLFDTDADSLDVTATISDFTDFKEHKTSFESIGPFSDEFGQVHGNKHDSHKTSLRTIDSRQRRLSVTPNRLDPNVQSEYEQDSDCNRSQNDSSDEEQPEHDGDDKDRMAEEIMTHRATDQLEQTTYFRSRPTEHPRMGEKHTEPALTLHTDPSELFQESASKYKNEPSRVRVIPIASEAVGRGAFGTELGHRAQSGQKQITEASAKHERANSIGHAQHVIAGNRCLLRAGTSTKTSPGNALHFEEETHEQHVPTVPGQLLEGRGQIARSQDPTANFAQSANSNRTLHTTTFGRPYRPSELPFVGDSGDPDARDDQDKVTPNTRKHTPDLDYTLSQLGTMSYDQLSSESFDSNPQPPEGSIPEGLVVAPLSQKLQYVYDLKQNEKQHLQRRAIFSSMTMSQYEECGDLLTERFGEIMTKYKQARQQKRQVAMGFEDEVARREERIRGKREAVDGDLRRLRRAGEDVVRGKEN